ncbi:hypothetical protein EMCRGX_G034785 [Ephydatia muelleri]
MRVALEFFKKLGVWRLLVSVPDYWFLCSVWRLLVFVPDYWFLCLVWRLLVSVPDYWFLCSVWRLLVSVPDYWFLCLVWRLLVSVPDCWFLFWRLLVSVSDCWFLCSVWRLLVSVSDNWFLCLVWRLLVSVPDYWFLCSVRLLVSVPVDWFLCLVFFWSQNSVFVEKVSIQHPDHVFSLLVLSNSTLKILSIVWYFARMIKKGPTKQLCASYLQDNKNVKMEVPPLTKAELQKTLLHLIEHDDDFLSYVHSAYMQTHSRNIS